MTDNQAKLEARRELLATQEGTSRELCLNVSSAWSKLTQLNLFSHVPPLGELKLLLESREEERRHAEESNMKAKKDSLEAEKTIADYVEIISIFVHWNPAKTYLQDCKIRSKKSLSLSKI